MNADNLNLYIMRTALEKISFSECICGQDVSSLTRITCCPSCLAKDTLAEIDKHKPHINKTVIFDPSFIGT